MLHLAWRGFTYHWAAMLMAVVGVAVATATITGALVLGDSLRSTLSGRLLARLGPVEQALIAPLPLRSALADEVIAQARPGSLAALRSLSGTASDPASGAVVPITLLGVEDDVRALLSGLPALPPRSAAISPALARDLGVGVGGALVLTVGRAGTLPSGSAFSERRRDQVTASTRVDIATVLSADGAGGFSLEPGLDAPRTVLVSRRWLAGVLGADRVDIIVAAAGSAEAVERSLASRMTLTDLGVRLVTDGVLGQVTVQGASLVLPARQAAAIRRAAVSCNGSVGASAIHLADRLTAANGASASYALVAALEEPSLLPLGPEDIGLSTWLAEDLGVGVGSLLTVGFPVPGADGGQRIEEHLLTVRGLVPTAGAAADPVLVPAVAGLTDAARIDRWDIPYPIDQGRISDRDEVWWAERRTLPKAFVHPALVQGLWNAGPLGGAVGWIAGLRVRPPSGEDLPAFAARLEVALQRELTSADAQLVFRPLRQQALARAQGNADPAGLFLGLGLFIIAAGVAVAGLLVRLQVERRAGETGILAVCGWSEGSIRRLLLAEGCVLAAVGAVAGTLGGIVYAALLAALLAAGWGGAAMGVPLQLNVQAGSLVIGAFSGFVAGAVAAWWGVRSLRGRPILDLLAGWRGQGTRFPADPGRPWGLFVGIVVTLVCLAAGPAAVAGPVAGAGLLLAGCSGSVWWLRRLRQRQLARRSPGLLLAEAVRDPRRSRLTVGLVASSAFLLIVVAAQRGSIPDSSPAGPYGGYALRVTTALPLHADLDTPSGRARLGFTGDEELSFAGTSSDAFLMSPGEDISCRNPTRPAVPRLLGVLGGRLPHRGGFGAEAAAWATIVAPADGSEVAVLGDADSTRWTLGAEPGGVLAVELNGAPRRLRLVGTFPASVFAGELVTGAVAFRRIHPEIDAPRCFLLAVPPERIAAVATILRRRLAGAEVRTCSEIVAAQTAVKNAYLSLFLALGGLGLLLGIAGLAATLARGVIDRRGELALLAALGHDRRALGRQVLGSHALLIGAGLAVGCGAAAVTCGIAPPAAGSLLAAALPVAAIPLVGLLSAALVVRWLLRGDPLQELRHE